jgi:hypothetical protein
MNLPHWRGLKRREGLQEYLAFDLSENLGEVPAVAGCPAKPQPYYRLLALYGMRDHG